MLLVTIADTTWRMFIPTIGFTIAGVSLDNILNTKPWLTIVGIIVGVVIAFILVIRQLSSVRSGDE